MAKRKPIPTKGDRAKHKAIHEKFSKESPSLDDLVASGDVDPNRVTTQGDYQPFRVMILKLKRERLRLKLSLKTVAERMEPATDAPAISRLERGENDNPTIFTLMQYASALGKRLTWSFEDKK